MFIHFAKILNLKFFIFFMLYFCVKNYFLTEKLGVSYKNLTKLSLGGQNDNF